MKMYNTEEIDNAQAQWMLNRRFTGDAKINALIRGEVENYLEEAGGYPAPAHFERFYLQLLNDGKIQPFRGSLADQPSAAPAVSQDTIAFIESPRTTASQLRNRYNTDPLFRKQYDAYEKSKGQKQQQPTVVSLTAEQYHALPAATIVQNYRTDHPRGFKAAVDSLIKRGLIALVLGLLLHGGLI
jgi:hypothetical protein